MEGWRPVFFLSVTILGFIANILATVHTATCEASGEETLEISCYYAERVYQVALATLMLFFSLTMLFIGTHFNRERQRRYFEIKRAISQLSGTVSLTSNLSDVTLKIDDIRNNTNILHYVVMFVKRILSFFARIISRGNNTQMDGHMVSDTRTVGFVELSPAGGTASRRTSLYNHDAVTHNYPLKISASEPVLNDSISKVDEDLLNALQADMRETRAKKVSKHQINIGLVLACATCIGYTYKFLLTLMFRDCMDEMDYSLNPLEHVSDAAYYFACMLFYVTVSYWINTLNHIPQRDIKHFGGAVVSDFVMALLVLLFIKVNAAEGLEVHHQLLEAQRRRTEMLNNATHYEYRQARNLTLDTEDCTETKKIYLEDFDERFVSPIIYLFKAEAIPVLTVLLRAVARTHVQEEHPDGDLTVVHNSVSRIVRFIVIVQAVLANLACLASIYVLFDYITGPADNTDRYKNYTLVTSLRELLQLTILISLSWCIKPEKHSPRDLTQKAHRQHAKLDTLLLFIALAPIYVLVATSVISQSIEWHITPSVDLNVFGLLDNLLLGVLYTAQYMCFRSLMFCTSTDLLRFQGLILPGIVGLMGCSLLVWFTTFVERLFIDHVFVASQLFYSETIWTAIVAGAYPGLAFINFHSAVCCMVLIYRKRQMHRVRRKQLESMLAKQQSFRYSQRSRDSQL